MTVHQEEAAKQASLDHWSRVVEDWLDRRHTSVLWFTLQAAALSIWTAFFLFYTPSIHLCKHTDENSPATTDAKNLAPQQKSAALPKFANQSTPLSPEKILCSRAANCSRCSPSLDSWHAYIYEIQRLCGPGFQVRVMLVARTCSRQLALMSFPAN